MLTFQCSSCGSTLQIDMQYAGRKVTCPGCATVVTAPTTSTLAGGEIQKPAKDVPPSEKSPEAARKRRRMDRDEERVDKKPSTVGWLIGLSIAVVLSIPCCGFVGFLLLIPAIQRTRDSAMSMQELNNFKQLALAAHNHHDTHGSFPSPKVFSLQHQKSVDLSWRVSVLPFIEQVPLFNMLDKDSDFNSPRNVGTSTMSIPVYMSIARGPSLPPGMTFNQTFTGPNTMFPREDSKTKMQEIVDGTSNTFMYAEALAPVTWMKGQDISIGGAVVPVNQNAFNVSMADGSVRRIQRNRVADDILLKLINPRDGAALPVDWENGGR